MRQLDNWVRQLREPAPDAKDARGSGRLALGRLPALFQTTQLIVNVYAEMVGLDLPLYLCDKLHASLANLPWDQIRPIAGLLT